MTSYPFHFRENGVLKSSLQALVFEFRTQALLAFRLGVRANGDATGQDARETAIQFQWLSCRLSTRRLANRAGSSRVSLLQLGRRVSVPKHKSMLEERSWEIFSGDWKTSNHFIDKCKA